MQKDYGSLEPLPEELWNQPDANPHTGPWANPFADEARQTMVDAWMDALNERERRMRRQDGRDRSVQPLVVLQPVSSPPVPSWHSWIEHTAKDD